MGSAWSKSESSSQSFPDDFIRRIVVLGKTGAGKSSLANTLFGEKVYNTEDSANSGTSQCQAELRTVNGKSIKLIDTPGFFDTGRDEKEMKEEILKCLIESAPGPHIFMIVLTIDKYTPQEGEIIEKVIEYFQDEALKFTTVLFTHGDQLPEGTTIEDFVQRSKDLEHLIKKCGNRCNVIDNKYWNKPEDDYRSNEFHVKEILNTIDTIIRENGGGYYTYELPKTLNADLKQEHQRLKQESRNLLPDEIQEKAKAVVKEKWSHYLLRVSTDVFLSVNNQLIEEEPFLALVAGLTKAFVSMLVLIRRSGGVVSG